LETPFNRRSDVVLNQYLTGNVVTVRATFQAEGSTLPVTYTNADPTAVTLKTRDPNGVVTTYTYGNPDGVIVRDAVGSYHAFVTLATAGMWTYHWVGTGAAAGVGEQQIFAGAAQIA